MTIKVLLKSVKVNYGDKCIIIQQKIGDNTYVKKWLMDLLLGLIINLQ